MQRKKEVKICEQIKELMKSNNKHEAYKMTLKYPNSPIVQGIRLEILVGNGEYLKAKVLGDMERLKQFVPVQSERIKLAEQENDWEKIEEIGSRDYLKDNLLIQSQILKIAIQNEYIEKIEEIGNRFPNQQVIQEQILNFALKQGDLEKAKEIGNRKAFLNNASIQVQMMKIAIIEGDFEKINEITNRTALRDDKAIKSILRKAEKRLKKNDIESNKIELEAIIEDKYIEEKEIKTEKEVEKSKLRPNMSIDKKVENIQVIVRKPQNNNTIKFNNCGDDRQQTEFKERIKNNNTGDKKMKSKPKKERQNNYNEDVKRILNYLEKDRIQTYVKMQSEDIVTRRNAIKRWDKIEILYNHLKESLAIMNGADIKNKEISNEFLKNICEKFRKFEIKEKQKEEGSR